MTNTERNPADVQDIVERLRAGDLCELEIAGKAADEIERLRAALQQSRSAVIEECAAVADAVGSRRFTRDLQGICNLVAKQIRALSQESADATQPEQPSQPE